jgi:1-acyl-sn-glycerol-3-phosphate acyltransferase
VAGRFFRLIGVTAVKLIPFWRFGIAGPVPPRGQRPRRTVVVSNHASHADPFLISHLPWEMKWLGKKSLFKVPFAGWAMKLAGDVPVTRGEASSARGAMAICKQWLERGMPVMIFPEGTRSDDGVLGPFKDGAFRLALDAGADVLPLAVHGTRTALPKHSWRFGTTRARVMVGTPIASAGKTVEALKNEARAQIEKLQVALRREAEAALGLPATST